MHAVESSADVLAAATALAGLVLVFLGSTVSGYGQFDATDQPTVRAQFRRRGWFAFCAFLVCLVAAVAALIGEEYRSGQAATLGAVFLILALVLVAGLGLLTVMEIE